VITQVHLKIINQSTTSKNVLCRFAQADYGAICSYLNSLCLRNDLPAVDPNPTLTDMRRRYRIHVIFGGQRRQTYLSAVAVLAVRENGINNHSPLVYQKCQPMELTSLSAFSFFRASIACISRMDSSTLPCSPAEPGQFSKPPTSMTAFPLLKRRKGAGRTIDLDLLCSSLNCQFDFRNLAHLEVVRQPGQHSVYMTTPKT